MRERVKRRVRKPPDLTSLFDVMFIVVFVALIRAAAAQQAAATPAPVVADPRPKPPPIPQNIAELRTRALAQIGDRVPLVIRVSAQGTITGIEAAGVAKQIDLPLLEQDPDPDVGVKYLGDRSAELRLCKVAALQLAKDDLAPYLVIVALDVALEELPHALFDGLHRDLDRCYVEQHGLATLVPPPTATPTTPATPMPPMKDP